MSVWFYYNNSDWCTWYCKANTVTVNVGRNPKSSHFKPIYGGQVSSRIFYIGISFVVNILQKNMFQESSGTVEKNKKTNYDMCQKQFYSINMFSTSDKNSKRTSRSARLIITARRHFCHGNILLRQFPYMAGHTSCHRCVPFLPLFYSIVSHT